jgi:glutathione-independent formaldehyde dehydrogenase
MCGEIVEVGDAVDQDRFAVGDWVTIPFNISCGTCDHCKNGFTNNCQVSGGLGGIYGYAAGGGW